LPAYRRGALNMIGLAVLLLSAPVANSAPPTHQPAEHAATAVAVDPDRLALARATVDAIFPAGTSARMAGQMFGGTGNGILDLKPADIGMADPKADSTTLREALTKKDPYFEQRMRITGEVVTKELERLGPQIESPLRNGLAESVAHRFTSAQLADINRFLATDSGKAFGSELLFLWFDPAVIKGVIGTVPIMMKEVPEISKKVEAATAKLPKPKREIQAKPK
jgi:hypothetical protein